MKRRIAEPVIVNLKSAQAHFLRKYMRLAKNQASRAVELELDYFSSFGNRPLLDEWFEAREVLGIIIVDAASFISEQAMCLLGNSVKAHELRYRNYLKGRKLP